MFWFCWIKYPHWMDLCGNNTAAVLALFSFFAQTSQSSLEGSICENDGSVTHTNEQQLMTMMPVRRLFVYKGILRYNTMHI